MNTNKIMVFDFETGSTNPQKCEVLQLAAVIIDPIGLKIVKGSEFQSYIQPTSFELESGRLEQDALDINKISLESLRDAPDLESVWKRFVEYCMKWNPNPRSTYKAVIPAGYNIVGFDIPIMYRLAVKFKDADANGKPKFINTFRYHDLGDDIWRWFEGNNEMENYKMDSVRDYFGLSRDGSHNAIIDTNQTAELIMRFMKLYRASFASRKFKGSFSS